MRRFLCALLCVSVGIVFLGTSVYAMEVNNSAVAAVVIDVDSGQRLYEKNADSPMLIASITKIMTAVVILENCAIDDVVCIREEDMVEGSSMYLNPGEEVTVETLLYGMLLCSGNDAAMALARYCDGDVETFVDRMNETAAQIGMTHSSFANPSGLDDEKHYSTAGDMARLAAYAMKNATFERIVSTQNITIGGRSMNNHNRLLNNYPGCIGVKTGYTRAAGRTLVSCAERNGLRFIAVTLNDANDWADHAAMLDCAFSKYQRYAPAQCGEAVAEVPVINGCSASVPVVFCNDLSLIIPVDQQVEAVSELQSCAVAPLRAGEHVGWMVYRCNGEEIGRVECVCARSVEALPMRITEGKSLWDQLREKARER